MARLSPEEIRQLSVSERVELAEEIWDSIADNPEALAVPESQRRELDRRLKLFEKDPDTAAPWSEIRSRLLDS